MSTNLPPGYIGVGENAPDGAEPEPQPLAPFRKLALATATRDYARSIEAGLLERRSAADLAPWIAAMGPEIWAWQRARLLTDQPPWRASSTVEEAHERVRAGILMERDLATWEKALLALDAQAERARLYGRPAPAPLVVPAAILAVIEAKRKAALERTTRARARGEGGGSPPALKPDEDLHHLPFPSKPR